MSGATESDAEVLDLVRQAQAGDEAAFEHLVRRFYDRIHRWALVRTGDGDEADDVAQEVLVRLHRHLPSYDARARFTTWLYQVMRNVAADLHRGRTRRERLLHKLKHSLPGGDRVSGHPQGGSSPEAHGIGSVVRAFFAELPARQREVFDLVDLQGLSPTEVAEMLDMKPVTVRGNLLRARRAIRRKILERHPELVEGYRS